MQEEAGNPSLCVAAVDAAGALAAVPLADMMLYDGLVRSPDLNGDGIVGPDDLGTPLGGWTQ